MANAFYPSFLEGIISGAANVDLSTDTVKLLLVTSAYTYDSTDENLDDIVGGVRVATSAALTSKTTTDGTFDSADVTFSSVSGSAGAALIMFVDSGVEATSPLVMFLDTNVGGLPVTPTGDDIAVTVDASGWFDLAT